MNKRAYGFTIVELLIVIVIIAILAAISIVAYTGVQNRAKNSNLQSTISMLQRKVEAYYALNGQYPLSQSVPFGSGTYVSSSSHVIRVDANCVMGVDSTIYKGADWIPDLDVALPQSNGEVGAKNQRGCFVYQSNGVSYILSAWNMTASPQTNSFYRRLGFRETPFSTNQQYLCNHSGVGGGSTYSTVNDYYKYSYTASNITTCNETPPSGA